MVLNESGKRVITHGVSCPIWGIAKCIIQDTVTKKDDIFRSNNTMKSVKIINDSKCEDLVAMYFYDSKPGTLYLIHVIRWNGSRKIESYGTKRKLKFMWIKLTNSVFDTVFITGWVTGSGGGKSSSGYMKALSPIFMLCMVKSMKYMEGNSQSTITSLFNIKL